LFGYEGLLIYAFAKVVEFRDRQDLRAVIGAERYYEIYPRGKRRWERRMTKQELLRNKLKERNESHAVL